VYTYFRYSALLKQVVTAVGLDKSKNLQGGFQACGICLLDEKVVLARLPSGRSQEITNQVLSDSLMEVLQDQAGAGCSEQKKRK